MHDTTLGGQIGLSVAIVHGLQFLKDTPYFPWLNQYSDKLLKAISLLIAIASAIGITFAMEGDPGTGWHIAATVPPLNSMIDLAGHFLTQYGVSQAYYHGVVKPK